MDQSVLESSGLRRFLLYTSLVLGIATWPRQANAQSTDVAAEASQSYRPSVALAGAPGVDVGAAAVQVAVSSRIWLGPRTFILAGVAYRGQYLDYEGTMPAGLSDSLHTIELPLRLVHILDEHWSFVGGVAPGLSGDFSGLDRHFRFSTVAIAAYAFGRDLVVGFGAVLDYGAGRVLPLPALTVDWHIVDGLRLSALGPIAKLYYRFGDRVETGAFAQFDAARWAVNGGSEASTIDYFAVDVGALLNVRLAGTTWVNALAGWSPFRRYSIDGGTHAGHYDPDAGLFLRAGLEIRLPGR